MHERRVLAEEPSRRANFCLGVSPLLTGRGDRTGVRKIKEESKKQKQRW